MVCRMDARKGHPEQAGACGADQPITELQIKKEIRFGRKYEVPLPFIHGHRHPVICMPMKSGDGAGAASVRKTTGGSG